MKPPEFKFDTWVLSQGVLEIVLIPAELKTLVPEEVDSELVIDAPPGKELMTTTPVNLSPAFETF